MANLYKKCYTCLNMPEVDAINYLIDTWMCAINKELNSKWSVVLKKNPYY